MTYVEQLGEQGQANRRLGEEILQQRHLLAVHTAANRTFDWKYLSAMASRFGQGQAQRARE